MTNHLQLAVNETCRDKFNAKSYNFVNRINCNILFPVVHDFVSTFQSMRFPGDYSSWRALTVLLSTRSTTGDVSAAGPFHDAGVF
jgi:hypothetical protein